MTALWPEVILNGAVVALLWGLLWRGQHQRVELLQGSLDHKVERDFCVLRHADLHEVLAEMKRSLERVERTLEEVKLSCARAEAAHDHQD